MRRQRIVSPQRIFSYEPDRESQERQRVILPANPGTFSGLLSQARCDYAEYFHTGQRTTVVIAVGEGEFQDWAEVVDVQDDTLTLRLSRDALPQGVQLHQGASVLVLVGERGNLNSGFSCRAELVSAESLAGVQVRCLEEVQPNSPREFFRVSAEIPATLFNLTSVGAEPAASPAVQGAVSRITTISGGGIRTESTMETAEGDIVYVTFDLPLPDPRPVPVVAQVVYSKEIGRSGEHLFSSGLRYLHINERDRDSIVRFVCNEEIKRMRYREGL